MKWESKTYGKIKHIKGEREGMFKFSWIESYNYIFKNDYMAPW